MSAEQQYSKAVTIAVNQGILTGNADGAVQLETEITAEKAIKMIVAGLGWTKIAMQSGGYPTGYSVVAGRIGVLKNSNINGGALISKKKFSKMLSNAFDAKLFENDSESDETLQDRFLDMHDLEIREGILEATKDFSILGKPNLKEDYVVVSGARVFTKDADIESYLGYDIRYIVDTDTDDMLRFCVTDKNVETRIDKNKDPVYSAGKIMFQNLGLGERKEADEYFKKALAFDPNHPNCIRYLREGI